MLNKIKKFVVNNSKWLIDSVPEPYREFISGLFYTSLAFIFIIFTYFSLEKILLVFGVKEILKNQFTLLDWFKSLAFGLVLFITLLKLIKITINYIKDIFKKDEI